MLTYHLHFGKFFQVGSACEIQLDVQFLERLKHVIELPNSKDILKDDPDKFRNKLSFDKSELKMKGVEDGGLSSVFSDPVEDGIGIIVR